jgi:hypothetical protein
VPIATAAGGYVFAAIGVAIAVAGVVTLSRGRTLAPRATRTTNADSGGRARAVGLLWIVIGVAFVAVSLR